jgi:N-acetylmuramoyl-L-alanine amidase
MVKNSYNRLKMQLKGKYQMPYSARELFARLIKCEAGGEGIDGMKAVASVVMNRVNVAYGEYLRAGQGDLRKVIEDPCEFTCLKPTLYGASNPQTVWSSNPEQIHYDVADWALAGNKVPSIELCLWYYNPYSPVCTTYFPPNRSGIIINRINEHCFYNPTSLYAST